MSELRHAIGDYLRVRRSLGFALRDAEWLLADFASYLEQQGAARVTAEHALAWARKPQGTHPHWWHQRLAVVREFARYLHTIDPLTELPAPDLLPACYSRRTPYLYSDADIAALMRAARSLSPPLRAATYQTLVGLLAVSGLRIGEAIRLDQDDFHAASALLVVRHSSTTLPARCRCTPRPSRRCRATASSATSTSRTPPRRPCWSPSAAPGCARAR